MATLLEMAKEIVAAHAQTTALTTDELIREIHLIHAVLQQLESGSCSPETQPSDAASAVTTLTLKQAFKTNEVVCMICGKGGMKTLARHLAKVHSLKPGEYKKQFGIPSSQALTAKNFSEARRKMAQDRGLADNLAKAREIRAAKLQAKKAQPEKPVKVKAAPKAKPAKAPATPKVKAAPKAKKA